MNEAITAPAGRPWGRISLLAATAMITELTTRLASAERALDAAEDVIAIAEMSPDFDLPNVDAYAAITVAKELASEHRRLVAGDADSSSPPLSIEVAAGFAGEEVDCG